mgnify:CR=1 FL=1|jgi:hypothetical protein
MNKRGVLVLIAVLIILVLFGIYTWMNTLKPNMITPEPLPAPSPVNVTPVIA